MLDLKDKSILITGGTGSFGKKFVEIILKNYPNIKRLIVYSRDELKQFEMSQIYSPPKYPSIRYFIGDVREEERLKIALYGIDYVIHAAALKQVSAAEYNPIEFIKTNVLGAENIITASMKCGVKKVIALSTDKAAAPVNLYGATKLCADKLFVAANNFLGARNITYSIVRYGNVIGSRGSVIPYFLEKRKEGKLYITHPDMTRFSISLEEGINLVLHALEYSIGGEIFVPKIPSFKITDLAKAIAPKCKMEIVGIRPGEKIHEEMITETDALNTMELDNHYIIIPSFSRWNQEEFIKHYKGKMVNNSFKYSSDNNTEWLNIEQIREQIKLHVDPNFQAIE